MNKETYYMLYEDFDMESHFPKGIFKTLKELQESIFDKNLDLRYYRVYEIPINQIFDYYDLKEVKGWKNEG